MNSASQRFPIGSLWLHEQSGELLFIIGHDPMVYSSPVLIEYVSYDPSWPRTAHVRCCYDHEMIGLKRIS